MTPTKKIPATIMIVTDDHNDATIIGKQLAPEFEHVLLSLDPEQRVGFFDLRPPDVLVLAFKTLNKSEEFYLELYRLSEKIHLQPHRTVVLCNKLSVQDAYALCRKAVFDDYVMFWPMTYDVPRLRMSVHNALREQQALKRTPPVLGEFARQARSIVGLEELLEQQASEGNRHIASVDDAVNLAEQSIGSALAPTRRPTTTPKRSRACRRTSPSSSRTSCARTSRASPKRSGQCASGPSNCSTTAHRTSSRPAPSRRWSRMCAHASS